MKITSGTTDWDNVGDDTQGIGTPVTKSEPKTPVKPYRPVSDFDHTPPNCKGCGKVIPHSETHLLKRNNSYTEGVRFDHYHVGCNPHARKDEK